MPIERRTALIQWANESGALIFEDDYDSEYRYAQRPIPALQGLDRGCRTVYVGSFSKVVFPSLSIGYAIVPHNLIEAFKRMLGMVARPVSQPDQLVLAEFIQQGHFARHLRKMRTVHEERRTALVQSVEKYLSDQLEIIGADAGLHAAARLINGHHDQVISKRANEIGIAVKAISDFLIKPDRKPTKAERAYIENQNGLIFGFACCTPRQISAAIRKMVSLF